MSPAFTIIALCLLPIAVTAWPTAWPTLRTEQDATKYVTATSAAEWKQELWNDVMQQMEQADGFLSEFRANFKKEFFRFVNKLNSNEVTVGDGLRLTTKPMVIGSGHPNASLWYCGWDGRVFSALNDMALTVQDNKFVLQPAGEYILQQMFYFVDEHVLLLDEDSFMFKCADISEAGENDVALIFVNECSNSLSQKWTRIGQFDFVYE